MVVGLTLTGVLLLGPDRRQVVAGPHSARCFSSGGGLLGACPVHVPQSIGTYAMTAKSMLEAIDTGHRLLVTPEEIRQWGEARSGVPAIEDRPPNIPGPPILRIVFDQHLLNAGKSQYVDRPGGLDLVSWDEGVAELEVRNLALRVAIEAPGMLDDRYEFVELDRPRMEAAQS